MNILIATGIYPPESGGPATYSKLLFDELPVLGIDVEVLPYRKVAHIPKIFRHSAYFLKVLQKGRNVDLIYAQDPVSVGFPAVCASVILRKPFVVKIVGDYAWEQGTQRFGVEDLLDEFSTKGGYGFTVGLMKKIELFVAKHAHTVVVPSNYLKKIVSNWGVDEDKISVVYNAFDVPNLLFSKEKLREKHKIKDTTLISVGRLVPWKGFKTLIEVFPKIQKKIPNLCLVIVGDGADRKMLELYVSKNNLQESVRFTGQLSHNETLEHIAAADMFVLNTSYEGFSHLLLETMALKTPLVTTNAGGNPELIENRKEGLLVECDDREALANSIYELLEDTQKTQKYSESAFNKVSKFTKERMLKSIVELLSSVKK
ncbi:MAG: glycosyltransferase family 4 protein [Candidatus Pacebacteria bacterium]|nr:glycosyltransferase family 4 protein [Candidatus Paceibacterota bacterium]